jgi:hypothetical protein
MGVSTRNRRRVIAALIVGTMVIGACSDDDSSGTSTDSTPSSEPATTESSTTVASGATDTDASDTTEPPDTASATTEPSTTAGGDLVGQWVADTGEILTVLTEPFGGGAPACTGPYVITFGDDGSFTAGIDATCVVGDIEATGELGITGSYTTDGSTLQVVDTLGEGTMTAGGVAVPLPIVDGLAEAFGPPAQYAIVGDVLSLTFTSPDGIEYTLDFTRAG